MLFTFCYYFASSGLIASACFGTYYFFNREGATRLAFNISWQGVNFYIKTKDYLDTFSDTFSSNDEEEDEDFDESELLAKLTGGATLKDTKDENSEPKEAPTPKKKAVKKTIAKKSITKKKVVKKAAPPKSNDSDVNMGKGIKNVTCPSCATVHHIDENTPKFICSCGRRIRV